MRMRPSAAAALLLLTTLAVAGAACHKNTVPVVRPAPPPPTGTTATAPEDLPNKVKDILANRLDKTVFVKADARARYERVVDVVDNLRAAGVDQLGLLTDQKEPGKMENDSAAPSAK